VSSGGLGHGWPNPNGWDRGEGDEEEEEEDEDDEEKSIVSRTRVFRASVGTSENT